MRWFTLAVLCAGATAQGQMREAVFQPLGSERQLPERLLGANLIPFYEHLNDDPAKIAMLKTMSVAYARFPGGTVSQFWRPETGTFSVNAGPSASQYFKFWNTTAPRLNHLYPNGFSAEQYKAFCDAIGAEMVLVPNLDTSSIAEQRAWFQKMAKEGVVSHHIEMGNESFLAMGMDPDALRRYPNEEGALAIEKQYYDAIREYLPAGAKVSVQAAAENFLVPNSAPSPYAARFQKWNHALHAEPWFQAVNVNLYAPRPSLTGWGLQAKGKQAFFGALMGRYDSGADRLIESLAKRLPGKEIWVTEWNPRGGAATAMDAPDPATPAMQMHAAARLVFALLRHPEVTLAEYFMFNFENAKVYSVFVKEDGAYHPIPVAQALAWFNQAANGGASFREYEWGSRIPGGGVLESESYSPAVAGLFTGKSGRTLLIQNASESTLSVSLSAFATGMPKRIEVLAPPLENPDKAAAQIQSVTPATTLRLAPYSLTRVVWDR